MAYGDDQGFFERAYNKAAAGLASLSLDPRVQGAKNIVEALLNAPALIRDEYTLNKTKTPGAPPYSTAPVSRAENAGYTVFRSPSDYGLWDIPDLAYIEELIRDAERRESSQPYVVTDPVTGQVINQSPTGDPNYQGTPGIAPVAKVVTPGGGGGGGQYVETGYGNVEFIPAPASTPAPAEAPMPAEETQTGDTVVGRQIYEAVLDAETKGDYGLAGDLIREYENYTGQPFPETAPEVATAPPPEDVVFPEEGQAGKWVDTGYGGVEWVPDIIYSRDTTPPEPVLPVEEPTPEPPVEEPVLPVEEPTPEPPVEEPVLPVEEPVVPVEEPSAGEGTGGGEGAGEGTGTGDGTGDGEGDGEGDGQGSGVGDLATMLALLQPQYRTVTEEPGDVVDIQYLYDIGGESIFAPKLRDENEGATRPYVYAKSGGMIQEPYLEQILRLLGV